MSTTTNEVSILGIDIVSFRRILNEVRPSNKYEAVHIRHTIQDIENAVKVWKEEADSYLNDKCSQCEKAIIEDEIGNQFAVIRVELNETEYKQTPELIAAMEALEEAKEYLKKVQSVTPSQKVAKGKGYFYKVSKP